MASNIKNEIYTLIADQIKNLTAENIATSSTLMELGADSLDAVEIVLAVENKYKISISELDFESLHTVEDIINYVESYTKV